MSLLAFAISLAVLHTDGKGSILDGIGGRCSQDSFIERGTRGEPSSITRRPLSCSSLTTIIDRDDSGTRIYQFAFGGYKAPVASVVGKFDDLSDGGWKAYGFRVAGGPINEAQGGRCWIMASDSRLTGIQCALLTHVGERYSQMYVRFDVTDEVAIGPHGFDPPSK